MGGKGVFFVIEPTTDCANLVEFVKVGEGAQEYHRFVGDSTYTRKELMAL